MHILKMNDPKETAIRVFNSLKSNLLVGRYKASDFINESPNCIDLQLLKTLIINAIKNEYYVGKEDDQLDREVANTRMWLTNALAKISNDDQESTNFCKDFIYRKIEPFKWTRYWVLEGFITSNNPVTKDIADEVALDTEDPLVSMLASAYLASTGDKKSLDKIQHDLGDPANKWFALRALRIVPLHAAVPSLCEIVEDAEDEDIIYDAIMALIKIPSHWQQSILAMQALLKCIVKMRPMPWKDSIRAIAIRGLGNLKKTDSAPIIIEELADDNPSIAREAARSIEKILGISTTVSRIIESISMSDFSDSNIIEAYARALRWLERKIVAEELEAMIARGTSSQQEIAKMLLSEIGGRIAFDKLRSRTDVIKQFGEILEKTEEKVRILFENSITEAQKGFFVAILMDIAIFIIGLILIICSSYLAFTSEGNLQNWVGIGVPGGLGVLGVLYSLLVSNPRKQVIEAVDHLMQVKIIFLAYLRRLHQTDQAFTRLMMDEKIISIETINHFAEVIGTNMKDTISQHFYKANIIKKN